MVGPAPLDTAWLADPIEANLATLAFGILSAFVAGNSPTQTFLELRLAVTPSSVIEATLVADALIELSVAVILWVRFSRDDPTQTLPELCLAVAQTSTV